MITLLLLSCFTLTPSAVPLSQGGAQRAHPAEATNQIPEAQTPAPLLPNLEPTQSVAPQQPGGAQGGPQVSPQYLPSTHYPWSPFGESVMIIPLHMGMRGSQFAHQPMMPQQPLMFPSYGYFPLFAPPYRNQQPSSPHGFPNIPQAPLPQTPANQLPRNQALTVAAPSGGVPPGTGAAGAGPAGAGPTGAGPAGTNPVAAAPLGAATQPVQQQQQNPQIVYMLQQPMNPALGGLSSEELEMAAKLNQLGLYRPTVISNLPSGAVQTQSQATRFTNLQHTGVPLSGGPPMAGSGAERATAVQPQTQQPQANGGISAQD